MAGTIDESTPQRGGESWINYERTKYLGVWAALHCARALVSAGRVI
jgi:hypothetical protein